MMSRHLADDASGRGLATRVGADAEEAFAARANTRYQRRQPTRVTPAR
jgi:hypothetical protein